MVCGWNTVLVGVRTATEELESIIEYIQPPHWYSKSQNQPIGYSINWANDLSTFRNSDCFLSVTVGFKLVHSFRCFPFNPTEFTTRCRKVGQSTSWQDRNVQICHTNFFGWKSHLHKFVVLMMMSFHVVWSLEFSHSLSFSFCWEGLQSLVFAMQPLTVPFSIGIMSTIHKSRSSRSER